MSLSLGLLKKLKEDIRYTTIKEFENELKDFKKILNRTRILREREINEIKNETKRKFNMLDVEISDILENLDVNATVLKLRC